MISISSTATRAARVLALVALAAVGLSGCDGGMQDDVEAKRQALISPPSIFVQTTTFTVNAFDDVDDGHCNATHCSLREAINAANGITDTPVIKEVVIAFDLPPTVTLDCVPGIPTRCTQRTSYQPIHVSRDLPPIIRQVAIDGTTASGYTGTPLVELRGPGGARGVGLYLQSNSGGGLGSSSIRGLAITGFPTAGVLVDSGQNFLAANYFGLDPSGAVRANGQGLILRGDANHVGNTAPGDRNIISGNTGSGVLVCRSCGTSGFGTAVGNLIDGNLIGTAVGGKQAQGNQDGITVLGDGFQGSASAGGYAGPIATVIGGNGPTHRNVISGNRGRGIALLNGARDTRVGANFIGLNVSGAQLANGAAGVELEEADHTVLGTLVENGAVVTAGNVISGNTGDGVRLSNFTSQPHAVLTSLFDNLIGLDPTGTTGVGNGGSGLDITLHTLGTVQVGSLGHGNTIAFNHGAGVISAAQSVDIVNVRGNSIFSNGGLGVDLFSDGVTTLQVPTVLHATKTGATTKVDGLFDFHGFFNRTFEIDLFASHTCDPSGSGEGQTYLGTVSVTTTTNVANGSFSLPGLTNVNAGDVVTATATQIVSGSTALSGTTEFSACTAVSGS